MKKEEGIIISSLEFDRFEEDKAVLLAENNEEIILPEKMVPAGIHGGDILTVTVATDEAETKRKEHKAKEILNEILNIGSK